MAAYVDDDSEEDSELADPRPQSGRRSKSPISSDGDQAHNSEDEMDFMKVTSEKDQVSTGLTK